MSTNAKVIMWVVVAVVVVGGGVLWWMGMAPTATAPTAVNQAPAQTPTSTTPPPSNNVVVSDNSNAALQADLTNTDSQMNGFASDNTSVSNSMNDQPVQQSQF